MTSTAESNLWYRQKRPVIDEFLQTYKAVESKVSAQGFLYRPGFLADLSTGIERAAKFKLSDVNYAIVEQSVTRELAQAGHDFDLAVKTAMIEWQLEKMETLSDLEQEFADAKYNRALDKEYFDQLQVEVNLRQLVIIAAKAQYEEDMEEIKRQFFDIERSTFDDETALLNAKLLTAQKKLEVIPYIEEVLAKQQLVIDAETNNVDMKKSLITEKEKILDEKQNVITATEALNEKIATLIAAKQDLVTAREAIITAKEALNDAKLVNVGYLETYITELDKLLEDKLELALAKKANMPYMEAYITALENLSTARETLADTKEANLTYIEGYIDVVESLADARTEIATAKNTNLTYLGAYITKLSEQIDKQEEVTAEKVANIPYLDQYMTTIEDVMTAQSALIDAKLDILPKLIEKAKEEQAYSEEMLTWIEVKNAISAIKEQIAATRVLKAGAHNINNTSRINLELAQAALSEARNELERIQLEGKSDLLSKQIEKASELLARKELELDEKSTRELELFDEQVDFESWEEEQQYDLMVDISNYTIPKEEEKLRRVALARINKEGRLAALAANTKITSQLVHLLA